METIIKETDATKDYNIMDNSNLYTKNKTHFPCKN